MILNDTTAKQAVLARLKDYLQDVKTSEKNYEAKHQLTSMLNNLIQETKKDLRLMKYKFTSTGKGLSFYYETFEKWLQGHVEARFIEGQGTPIW